MKKITKAVLLTTAVALAISSANAMDKKQGSGGGTIPPIIIKPSLPGGHHDYRSVMPSRFFFSNNMNG